MYDTENEWRMVKDVHARNLQWTITDTCLSKDQRLLLYATINPVVHMVCRPVRSFHSCTVCVATSVMYHVENQVQAPQEGGGCMKL